MSTTKPWIFLRRTDVETRAPSQIELIESLERAYGARGNGGTDSKPKFGLYTEHGNFFYGSSALSTELGYAICHNAVGTPLELAGHGKVHTHCMDVLRDCEIAWPVAVLDVMWIGTMLSA